MDIEVIKKKGIGKMGPSSIVTCITRKKGEIS